MALMPGGLIASTTGEPEDHMPSLSSHSSLCYSFFLTKQQPPTGSSQEISDPALIEDSPGRRV